MITLLIYVLVLTPIVIVSEAIISIQRDRAKRRRAHHAAHRSLL